MGDKSLGYKLLFWLTLLLSSAVSAATDTLRLDKAALADAKETSILQVSGNNRSSADAIVVIRADDMPGPAYAQRANIERVVPPGEFAFTVPLASLRTPGGRQLTLANLEQILVFPGRTEKGFALRDATLHTPKPLGKNIFAWDLGPEGSAIWPGFTPLTINSPILRGNALQPIDRSARMQAADALTFDGIRGINLLTLPLPAGDWQITLWLRDAGEWEYLPHPLKREIRANGELVFSQKRSPKQWINEVYLAGRESAVTPESSSWHHFGKRTSDTVTFTIHSDGSPVKISLNGDTPDAGFVSAILAAPAEQPEVLAMVNRARERWWNENWPISAWTKWPSGQPSLRLQASGTPQAAPDSSVLLTFDFEQGNLPGAPMVLLRPPSLGQSRLNADWHWSQWQLTRTHLSSTLLAPNDDYLRHGMMPANQGVALPRRLVVRVDVPHHQPAGEYQGELQVMLSGTVLRVPFSVDVVYTSLPAMAKPVGIYLEKPVHFGWFKSLIRFGDDAMVCDLTFLRRLGLTGISPPYPTPDSDANRSDFDALTDTLSTLGFSASMAYAPAKRLTHSLGASRAASKVADIEARYQQRLQTAPFWSIADEPSNPGNVDQFKEMHRSFSMLAPNAKRAGHLNSPDDREYLSLFDLVLVNDGFGIDADDIKTIQSDVSEVWLYNLPNPRAAAGFYLWRSGADGFLKWHGRMPTADPFDPTDGREFDVQLLYPSANPCPEQPDIHTDLYAIMEGIVDHRWMQWLEAKAASDAKAHTLLRTLSAEIPDTWEAMQSVDRATLESWRSQIIRLAR